MTKQFHIGDMLSITTGRLVSPDHIDGVYRIIDFMTRVPHFTHQLPRGAEACKPYLIKQHPWLASVVAPETFTDEADVKRWVSRMVAEHGEFHDVTAMPRGAYVGRDPIAEMEEMVGKDRVIPVVLPRGTGTEESKS